MRSLREQRRRRRHASWLLLAGSVVVLAIVAMSLFLSSKPEPARKSAPSSSQPQAAPRSSRVTSKILVTGNTFWGRYIDDWSMASPLKHKYPFSQLNEFHRDNYDAWVSGLECPTVEGLKISSAKMDATLAFNCPPEYLKEAKKWYTAFTLANNHSDNQGADGFNETKQHLDDAGIQYFGHYDPTKLDDLCDVISMPITVRFDDATSKSGKLPMAFCGYHGVFQIPTSEAVDRMKPYAALMPVVAMPHMGAEYKPGPDEIKTDFYHSLIDAGADVVLGDHPHWVQNTESYKGHLIVYSMGNFMFDQQFNQEVTRSAAIQLSIALEKGDNPDLDKWLKLGEACAAYHDDCLERAEAEQLTKLNVTYQFGVVGTDNGGKLVKPATDAQMVSLLQRLNWRQTMSQLKAPYGSL